MLVDAERVLLELKREIAAKPSHGARDLLATLARLEVEHSYTEDDFRTQTRRFAHRYFDGLMDVLQPADDPPLDDAAASASAMGDGPHLRRPRDSEESCQTPQRAHTLTTG